MVALSFAPMHRVVAWVVLTLSISGEQTSSTRERDRKESVVDSENKRQDLFQDVAVQWEDSWEAPVGGRSQEEQTMGGHRPDFCRS